MVYQAGTSSGTPGRKELSSGISGACGGVNRLPLLLLLPPLLPLLLAPLLSMAGRRLSGASCSVTEQAW